jgi:peptidoglycan/xylan/chitin deacetylase (PgdA/CDA1 family)
MTGSGSPPAGGPFFVISLDFELMWGVRDKRTVQSYGENILGVREAVPAMLKLFREYQVKATWATVGLLMFDRRADLLRALPERRPTYRRGELDPYACLAEIGDDEAGDPYHYGLSLVRRIADCEGMEIGSHTFSHYYCLEAGQDRDQFRADMEASVAAVERVAPRPVSLVFPRNQCNRGYLEVCRELGFQVFRGNERAWMYREAADAGQSLLKRGVRLLDHYLPLSGSNGFRPSVEAGLVNCPASRFLRPFSQRFARAEGLRARRIKAAMAQAARAGLGFHLWWHPHNFGRDLPRNLALLEELLRCHAALRDAHGVLPLTMGEVALRMQNGS